MTGILLPARLVAIALALGSCSDQPTAPAIGPVASVDVLQTEGAFASLWTSLQLIGTARDSAGRVILDAAIVWTSSDTSVAWVDSNGRVTAVGNGEATVVAAVDGQSDSCSITVAQVAVSIDLYGDTSRYADALELTALDEWFWAGATARDAVENELENAVFQWSSSDPAVATVDSVGVVTAVTNGTTRLSATLQGVTANKMLTVRAGVRLLWNYGELKHYVSSSPAVTPQGVFYVVDGMFYVHAVDPDGSSRWKFPLGHLSAASTAAIAADGTIYASIYDRLTAINPDGSENWRSATSGNRASSPAIATDGTVYAVSDTGVVHAVGSDGSTIWQLDLHTGQRASMYSSPAIAVDGTIYVGSGDSTLNAINPDGSLQWVLRVGGEVYSSPAIDGDGTIYFGSLDGTLYAVSADGTVKWTYDARAPIRSSPAIGRAGTIYVGSGYDCGIDCSEADFTLHAVNGDGSGKWRFVTGREVVSSPAVAQNGTIYVGSLDGWLYAVHPDGTLHWRFKTKKYHTPYRSSASRVWSSPALGVDGTIYVCTLLYRCYALAELAGSNGGLADSPWPKFRHDNRNTGNVATP